MPVEIRLIPRCLLRTISDENYTLELPVIELAPTSSENLPHISRISCSVTGTPKELATKIESAYSQFTSKNPILLSTPQRLKQSACVLNQALPADISCTLQVGVEYFDSDTNGHAILSAPKNVTTSCVMWTPSDDQNPPKQKINLGIPFPGWVALDFGTSNSTVTLFDPKRTLPQDVLPREQEERLRLRLAQWLNSPPAEALPDTNVGEWEIFVSDLRKNLNISPSSSLGDMLLTNNSERLLEAIKEIELCLAKRVPLFRKAASNRLNQIYHEAFRIPPLESQNIIPVVLDATRHLREIKSEIEITDLEPLRVLMGDRVRQDRQKAIGDEKTDTNQIVGIYHHSLKPYFGQDQLFQVFLDGVEKTINVEQLIQAAWSHLIQLTEGFRQRNHGAEGYLTTAVVTYPTIASPLVRKKTEDLVKELGIPDVQIAYDEAVSAAIFFLWREFGGDLNLGIESFKTRCQYDRKEKEWSQKVLVLDIGGGTTDIALIRLALKEIDPFKSHENRGAGGRYYVLTPKLLGSSGHLQLGGELITLWIFRLLKVAIADCLLAAVEDGSLECETLRNAISELNERFVENGTFEKGKLLACVDKENPDAESAAYEDALKDAERIIPTQSKNSRDSGLRLQNFYTLWDKAEEAKFKLGKQKSEDSSCEILIFSEQEISNLLTTNSIEAEVKNPQSLQVKINRQQFEKAATRVIKDAIKIAKGLIESRLASENESNYHSTVQKADTSENEGNYHSTVQKEDTSENESNYHSVDQPVDQQVDWLILSGQTCNLYLVEDEIRREFNKYNYFTWNPQRVTFVPEFSKLATSAGACYAEKLRRLIFDPRASIDILRKGANQLYIDVKNLFYFLPCSFQLSTQRDPIRLFHATQPLYQLEPYDPVAKARSDWMGVQLLTLVQRVDFEGIEPQLWGSFDGKALADELDMRDKEFLNKIKAQFEVDYKLQFKLLLCWGVPYYSIAANLPTLDVKKALGTQAVIVDGKLMCDIAIHVLEAQTVDKPEAHHTVFAASKDYKESLKGFRYEEDSSPKEEDSSPKTAKGLISEPLPHPPRSGKHTFYFNLPNTKEWVLIGELNCLESQTEYDCKYRVSLDDKGFLRLHFGEVPYWTSRTSKVLAEQEGCVFQTKLHLQNNDIDEKRDPFCGKH